ncbi:MAG: hydroxypyruvate isomerase [Martelella sp.]|uniref:hydroxypyruvate isomerase n=1 Tax=unclassified Martelella TaxID=2629616 RepID=UPI000C58D1CD|nr:hydroxypyruvate isomerase [Martelella sp.]MAU22877.1 hydroxypyruvate isomerase [Martelella sp.]|tara:strand:+ start:422 stop:1198 length:777 start_codon:yes stop_codon:yes gene_type:complete
MPKFAANLSFLYADLPFLDRIAAAAKDGFPAVEYVGPYDFPEGDVAAALKAANVKQALFNLPAGDWAGGERGIGCLPDRVEEFKTGVDTAISYAKALGCPKINCLAGIAPKGIAAEKLEQTLVENLKYAAPRLADAGVKLLLEPINLRDIPGFFVSTTDHAERILEAVGSENLFIQYDIYHTQIMQGDLAETYRRLKAKIAHVQLADNPGRHEPGTGEINYPYLFNMLDAEGYDGFIGCEYKPSAGTSEGLGWMKPWL